MRPKLPAILLVLVAMLSTADLVAGQSVTGKGGVSLANVSFDPDGAVLSTTMEPGYAVGGQINFPLFSRLALQVEGLYATRVTEFAEIPVLGRITLMEKPAWQVRILGGVVYGRLLKARESFGSGISEDINESINSNDLAVSIGADLQWRRLVFDFRYLYGLSEVYAEPAAGMSARHRVMQITAGYRIF
jgi:Outer membrane protein beta-barrel domain